MANISIDVADKEARQDLQDIEDYVDSAAFEKQSLSVTQNGTYTAPTGTAYSPVVVDVVEQPWEPLEDGYSNFWFELTDDTLSPWLNFSAKNADAVIDWGDGSGEQSLDTLTPTHTYSKAGRYVVKVKGVTGITRQHQAPFSGKYLSVLKNVELTSEVTPTASYIFSNCIGMKNFYTSNSTMTEYMFNCCSMLQKVNLSPTITNISSAFFYMCRSLMEISIPQGVTDIGNSSFNTCLSLTSISIPSSVTRIGDLTFQYCLSLSEIHISATNPPTLGSSPFANLPADWVCYVPTGTGDTYKAAAGWSAYSDHILEEGQTITRAMQRKFEANALKADNSIDGADDESSDKR